VSGVRTVHYFGTRDGAVLGVTLNNKVFTPRGAPTTAKAGARVIVDYFPSVDPDRAVIDTGSVQETWLRVTRAAT
jgi:hypothetical protein